MTLSEVLNKLEHARRTSHDLLRLTIDEERTLSCAADAGDPLVQSWLGYYWFQLDAPSLLDAAIGLLVQGAKQGIPVAMTEYARFLWQQTVPDQAGDATLDHHASDETLDLLARSADAGDAPAAYLLFKLGSRKYPTAQLVHYLEHAAEARYCPAQTELGEMYYQGHPVVGQDWRRARELFEASYAESGFLGGDTAWLVIMHAEGQGVAQDVGKAVDYLERKIKLAGGCPGEWRSCFCILCEQVASTYELQMVRNLSAADQLARAVFWYWQCVRLGETCFLARLAALGHDHLCELGQRALADRVVALVTTQAENASEDALDWPSTVGGLNEEILEAYERRD